MHEVADPMTRHPRALTSTARLSCVETKRREDAGTARDTPEGDVDWLGWHTTSHGRRVRRFLQQSPVLALSSKILSPACAPDLKDIATYFFLKKYFDPISEYVLQ